jgi:hypothetical protein
MFFTGRTHTVAIYGSAPDLVDLWLDRSWVNSAGWQLGDLLFLNDQSSADGAFELGVIRLPSADPVVPGEFEGQQIESLTVSWMTRDSLLTCIRDLQAGGGVSPWPTTVRIREVYDRRIERMET